MEERINVIKADVKRVFTKKKKIVIAAYLILIIMSCVIGFKTEYFERNEIGDVYESERVTWFGKELYYEWYAELADVFTGEWSYYDDVDWYKGSIAFVSILYFILLIIPITIELISYKKYSNTSLVIDENQMIGSCSSVGKKTVQMSVEKINNIAITDTFWDKLRGGQTIVIESSSSLIKFHFVYNAQEVVDFFARK